MQYQEAVQEARRLVKRSEDDQWRLAQLTAEVLDSGIAARQWARDIDRDHTQILRWAAIWRRFGGALAHRRYSFSEAYQIVFQGLDEVEPGEVGAEQYRQKARTAVRNMPAEQKAEVVREAMATLPPQQRAEVVREQVADPVVAEVAMRDDETSVNVAIARGKHVQQRNEQQDEAARIRAPKLYEDGDVLSAQNSLAHVTEYLELAIKQIGRVPEHRRTEFQRLVSEIDRLTSWLHSIVDGQSLDEGLAKLLEGGDER